MSLFHGTWPEFVSAMAVYFAILDPFFAVSIFSAATTQIPASRRPREALVAAVVAVVVILGFAIGGTHLLSVFAVSLTGIKLGGGLVLLVLGVQTVLQKAFAELGEPGRSFPGVLIGSPVLAGPGAIVLTLMLREDHGVLFPVAASVAIVLVCYLAMLGASWISRHIEEHWVELFSRILGLLLVGYAADLILETVLEAVRGAGS